MKDEDRLERFINQHRDEFDTERPSLKVWAQIEKSLDRRPLQVRSRSWLKSIAAAVLVLVGVGLGLMIYPTVQEYRQWQAINNSEEINGLEIYFKQELEARFVELSGGFENEEQRDAFTELDQNIRDLKRELIHSPKHSREVILQAIIASYEAKVALLEKAIEGKNAGKTKYYETQFDI